MWILEPVLSLDLSLRERCEGRTDGCRYSVRKEKIRMKSNANIGLLKGLGPWIRCKRWTPTGLRPMDPDDDDDDDGDDDDDDDDDDDGNWTANIQDIYDNLDYTFVFRNDQA